MMRRSRGVLIVTQYFFPEPCAAAHRMESLARALRDRGMEVTVLAPMPSFPSGRIDAAYRGKLFLRDTRNGVAVVRLRHLVGTTRHGRYLAWLSFAALATLYATFCAKRCDVVVASSSPIAVAIPAIAVRVLRGARMVADVRDVFPDIGIQMGVWRENGCIARIVGAFAEWWYSQSSLVVAVTPTALEQVRRRAGKTRAMLVPNGCDRAVPRGGLIKRRNGEFVATFTGNMGVANGMDLLLDAAKRVAKDEIRIALVGGGAEYAHVASRIESERIENADLYGVVSREEAVGALAESDAALVVLREGINESIPTKLYDAFAVECPVVLSASGEARRVVTESVGGICSAPGDPDSLADALRRIAADRELARALGSAGRRYAAAFDRERIMTALAEHIAELAREKGQKT
jgi:glycosyltransferase involved in cell wall biosynthesis